ncbi:hypothetical protein JCM3774_000927 [Rhodotorula dairenensis]
MSTASAAPSASGSSGRPKERKNDRPRPANVAGPSFRVDQRPPPPARGCSECRSSYHSHDGDSANESSANLSGDESADGSVGRASLAGSTLAKKPLWAIGGVFPKHSRPRRSTTTTSNREQDGSRRGSVDTQAAPLYRTGTGSTAGGSRRVPSRRESRQSEAPDARRQKSSKPVIETIEGGETPGSQVIVDDESAGDWNASERSNPFEDVVRARSQTAPLDVVVSNDSGRSQEPSAATTEETPAEDEPQPGSSGDGPDLTKVQSSGSSPTVYGEHSPSEEKGAGKAEPSAEEEEKQDERDLEHALDSEEGHEAENTGQALGGKLDQRKDEWEDDTGDDIPIRNRWGTVRYALREPMAEFLGTMVLVVLGVGSTCQTKLSQEQFGAYSSENWAWGFGVMTALYIAGGISGGHANPSVTVVLAIFRGFPWKMVPRYMFAQILGAFCGALLLYGNYQRAINEYDPNKLYQAPPGSNISATLFITSPASNVGSPVQGFCQEILASGVLTIAVLALGDENNAPPGAGLGAIVLGFVVVAIGMSNGWVSGYAINPARDIGPRLALWCVGYGKNLWTDFWYWWLLGPIAGTLVGGIGGALLYDLLIFTGPGSPVNYSTRELWLASGIPTVHNMVWIALSPHKRQSRMAPPRFANMEHAAEAGIVPHAALDAAATDRPGKAKPEQLNDATLIHRYRRGLQKVSEQEEADRRIEEEQHRRIQESLEEERLRRGLVPMEGRSSPADSQHEVRAHDEETEGTQT